MIAAINKIINFSNVDGPYNRMAIFFQGCNYNCLFCHNPETINHCVSCQACVKTCPSGALKVIDGKVLWDDKLCVNCDTCLKTCKFNASPKISYMSVEDILKRIHKAKPYIRGITCSGGECTLNKEFMYELFVETKKLGLTCLIDSNGSLDFEKYPELLDISDGVMLDVKAVDKIYHDKLVSFNNEIILKNLDYLLDKNKLYEVRTIIYPNQDENNYKTVDYVSKHIQDKCIYKLIKYRPYGVREEYLDVMGRNETDDQYFKQYVELAKQNGVKNVVAV